MTTQLLWKKDNHFRITENRTCGNKHTGDCVPIALALIEDWSYDDAHDMLREYDPLWSLRTSSQKKCPCNGTSALASRDLLLDLGYTRNSFHRNPGFSRVNQWGENRWVAGRYPTINLVVPRVGTHLVFTVNHATVVRDGVIHDYKHYGRSGCEEYYTKGS